MWLSAILGFLSTVPKLIVKTLDYFRFKQAVETGREIEKGNIAAKEIRVDREQDEIMMKEQPKNETVKKLENGTF
jgi:hypothetical protein